MSVMCIDARWRSDGGLGLALQTGLSLPEASQPSRGLFVTWIRCCKRLQTLPTTGRCWRLLLSQAPAGCPPPVRPCALLLKRSFNTVVLSPLSRTGLRPTAATWTTMQRRG